MSTYLDYLDRTVDVSAFQGASLDGDVRLEQSLIGDEGGLIVTGIQKLAQRWALEFLTEEGSIRYDPDRGCPFVGAVRRGELLTELDVFQAFALSAPIFERNLQNEETDADPDDERFRQADLLSVVVSPTLLIIRVKITSRAGTSRAAILPISMTIL